MLSLARSTADLPPPTLDMPPLTSNVALFSPIIAPFSPPAGLFEPRSPRGDIHQDVALECRDLRSSPLRTLECVKDRAVCSGVDSHAPETIAGIMVLRITNDKIIEPVAIDVACSAH